MELFELNPHIRYARVHKSAFNYRKDISVCYDCRLFYFETASGRITINGVKYNVSSGTAVYVPPAQEYRFDVTFDSDTKIIILDFDLVTTFSHLTSSIGTATPTTFDKNRMPSYPIPSELSKPIVKFLPNVASNLNACAENFVFKDGPYKERSSALLKLCLLELVAPLEISARSALCKKVVEYVSKNYKISTLTNEEIASAFNYHPYHLNRIIKQETGKSLKNYITYYRLQLAKNLLLTTTSNVSQIASEVGFCTPAYFIKTFREKIGLTPKEYRRLQRHTEI
ncbi:MAG: helix-turn-helix transcriptional regulator [Clostridia bacterium]|nr:helix-turn-helix transcriptional regulator [Clostridia bacterium]